MKIQRLSIVLIIISSILCCEYCGKNKRQESMVSVKMGEELEKNGKLEEAEQNYSKALIIDSTNVTAYFNRARVRKGLKKAKGAIEDYTAILEISPKNERAYFFRACAKGSLTDYKGAILDFTRTIEINPKSGQAYCFRGIAKIELKDRLGACLDFSRAGELGYEDAYKKILEYCQQL